MQGPSSWAPHGAPPDQPSSALPRIPKWVRRARGSQHPLSLHRQPWRAPPATIPYSYCARLVRSRGPLYRLSSFVRVFVVARVAGVYVSAPTPRRPRLPECHRNGQHSTSLSDHPCDLRLCPHQRPHTPSLPRLLYVAGSANRPAPILCVAQREHPTRRNTSQIFGRLAAQRGATEAPAKPPCLKDLPEGTTFADLRKKLAIACKPPKNRR